MGNIERVQQMFKLPVGAQILLLGFILVVALLVLVGGGMFVFRFINDLFIAPIRSGNISTLAFIMLIIFAVYMIRKFRLRGD